MIKRAPAEYGNKNAKINFKHYCDQCGASITFYSFEPDKKVCKLCGRLNYKSELVKFKDKLTKKIKEVNE